MKTYTITLSSAIGQGSSGASKNNLNYNVNWNILPADKNFKVTFTLQSGPIANATVYIANLAVDLGQQTSIATSYASSKSTFLGILKKEAIVAATNGYYRANITDNKPLLIPKPQNSTVNVCVYNESGVALADFSADYVLNLYFEEI